MRNALMLGAAALLLVVFATPAAEAGNPFGSFFTTSSYSFMYKWLRDFDGDGIPNGQDEDWVPPEDGTGYQNQNQNQTGDNDPANDGEQNQYRYKKLQKRHQLENGDLDRLRLRDGSCDGK